MVILAGMPTAAAITTMLRISDGCGSRPAETARDSSETTRITRD
jgi:hypothetical protein